MIDIKATREKLAAMHAVAVQFATDFADKEITAEQDAEQAARFAEMDKMQKAIEAAEKLASYKFASDAPEVVKPVKTAAQTAYEFSEGANIVVGETPIDPAQFSNAVRSWASTGHMPAQFATITTATASSILLPKQVAPLVAVGAPNSFREGFAAYGLPVHSTPGDTSTVNFPIADPTAGGLVAENASSETENAPGLSQSIVSTVKTYQSGSVYYSNLQLSATSFDLLNATVPHLRFNKELGLEAAIIAAMIADNDITQEVEVADFSEFDFADSVRLANALPKRYQSLKVRLLSADAFAAAEGMVDSQGRPVMIADTQNQSLRRMGGTPTIRCDYLEAFGAANVVGLEISLSGFHFRDAGEGLARYDSVPARPNQTGINLFGYHAFGYSPSAVVKLVDAAS